MPNKSSAAASTVTRSVEASVRPPFSWEAQLAFRAPRCIPGVEEVSDGAYWRTARLGKTPALLKFSARDSAVVVDVTSLSESAEVSASDLQRMFDLETPIEKVDRHLSEDPLLGRLVAQRPGLRLPAAWDPFELSIRAILGQQITVKAASTLAGRIVEQFGEDAPLLHPRLKRIFPSAEVLAQANLTRIGMPVIRAETLRRFSSAVAGRKVPFHGKQPLGEFVEAMCELPGVGPWTAHYVALRGFGYADAFPSSDLGLIKTFVSRSGATNESTPRLQRALEKHAMRWAPYRGYAALHLWSAG